MGMGSEQGLRFNMKLILIATKTRLLTVEFKNETEFIALNVKKKIYRSRAVFSLKLLGNSSGQMERAILRRMDCVSSTKYDITHQRRFALSVALRF